MSRRRIFARIKRGSFEREESFWSGADASCWEEMVNETLDLLERLTMLQFDVRTYAIGLADSIRTFGGARTRAAWLSGEATPEDWARGHPVVTDDLSELMIATLRRNRH
jgi:hypothetical protein